MKWLFDDKEKLQHLLIGIVFSQILVLILSLCAKSIFCAAILSLIIASVVAYGKELLYDEALGLGVYRIRDFVASEIGVLYGIIISLIFLLL